MMPCPICKSKTVDATIRRARLPIFQNVVWKSKDEAVQAPSAPFTLATCYTCGFSFNSDFDHSLVVYNERYDNNVPSSVFAKYYRSLIELLAKRYDLSSGTVYDVGCGKGEFLQMLCEACPGIKGIGIDPSCTPVESGNFKLISGYLDPSHFSDDARLVVVRHVLEHIDQPVAFMRMIRGCVPEIPVFVEVPDLDWILLHDAFWDFCYEHCNYFTHTSLAHCLRAAGFELIDQQPCFGDQYQWALCKPGQVHVPQHQEGLEAVAAARAYASREAAKIAQLSKLAHQGGGLALWGMATKGVMMSAILGADAILGGVDVNKNKQGKFAAGSGVAINAPEWLCGLPEGTTTLLMNPNYETEIRAKVRELGAAVELQPV